MKYIIYLLIAGFSLNTLAATPTSKYIVPIEKRTEIIRQLELATQTSGDNCSKNWKEIRGSDELNITIALGYNDVLFKNKVFAIDKDFRRTLEYHMTKSCSPGYSVCEFKVALRSRENNITKMHKVITSSSGDQYRMNITITNGSHAFEDRTNQKSTAQKKHSELAKNIFLSGLKNSDVVLYYGHARDGGGPDFDPPRLTSHRHVNYSWYHQNRTDETDMLNALREPHRVKLLSLLACSSKLHFKKEIAAIDPGLALIYTEDVVEYQVLEMSLVGILDGIIKEQCYQQFSQTITPNNKDRIISDNFLDQTQL